jgi:transketolase subunit A (EC 2.2.1.1)
MDNERLAHIATEVRKSIIKAVTAAKSGHPGGRCQLPTFLSHCTLT